MGHSRPVTGLLYLEPSGPLQACNGTALPLYRNMYFDLYEFNLQTVQQSAVNQIFRLGENLSQCTTDEF